MNAVNIANLLFCDKKPLTNRIFIVEIMPYSEILCIFTQNQLCDYMKLNRIKEVLEGKGITQTWLAKQLDKSYNSVNAYVCNRTQLNLGTLGEIAKILEINKRDLLTPTNQSKI